MLMWTYPYKSHRIGHDFALALFDYSINSVALLPRSMLIKAEKFKESKFFHLIINERDNTV